MASSQEQILRFDNEGPFREQRGVDDEDAGHVERNDFGRGGSCVVDCCARHSPAGNGSEASPEFGRVPPCDGFFGGIGSSGFLDRFFSGEEAALEVFGSMDRVGG